MTNQEQLITPLQLVEQWVDMLSSRSDYAEQALAELEKVDMLWDAGEFGADTLSALDIIRRALEALPND